MYRSKYLEQRRLQKGIEDSRRAVVAAPISTPRAVQSLTKEFVSDARAGSKPRATRVYASAAATACSYSTSNSMSGEYSTWDEE